MIKLFLKTVSTAAVLVLIGIFVWSYIIPKLNEKETKENKAGFYHVRRVIDGDTFETEEKDDSPEGNGKHFRVRMLGVDTPEKYESDKLSKDSERSRKDKKTLQKLGTLASDYTKSLIEGRKIKLSAEQNHEDKDRYGRLLRYVYLEDGTLVNKKIIEEGYGYAYRQFKISKLDEFISAEIYARENKKGLWGETEGLQSLDSEKKDKRKNPGTTKMKKQ